MLAALTRRAGRMFVGLTLVTALSTGLALAPVNGGISRAVTASPSNDAVSVSIFPSAGTSVGDGQDLAVTISLTNTSTVMTEVGQIVVTTEPSVLGDPAQVDDWLSKANGEQQPGRWLGIVDAPSLPPGASIDLTATLPLSNAYYGSSWGPRGLAADLEIGKQSAGSGRGVIVWTTPQAPEKTRLVSVLPIVTTASASGLLTANELTNLTAPQGVLTTQLAFAADRNVTLAVDPRVQASIVALGAQAPASALSWLARLKTLDNESFTLAFADADVAVQAQAGASAVMTFGLSDQKIVAASSTTIPWAPTLANVTWPVEGSVISRDIPVLAPAASAMTILSSANVASGANSPSVVNVGDRAAFVTNAGLSQALRNASAAPTESQWSKNFSLASAYLAASALNPSSQGGVIATFDRKNAGGSSLTRAAFTLDGLAALPWVDAGSLGAVSASASVAPASIPVTSIVDMPESEDRVRVAEAVLARHNAVADFSSVLATPSLLTDSSTRQELALFSVAWMGDDNWAGAVDQYQQETSLTLNSIRIVTSSEIQMVGGQVNIPVTIENTLPFDVTVLVRATPSNARLRVDNDATIVIRGEAQAKALIPVVARVGNGSVMLGVSLFSATGVPIGSPGVLPVNVRADWEGWGLGVLGALFAALLITGVIRTVRKRRDETAVTSRE